MEHFFPQIQVDTYTQMHTKVKLLGDAYEDHTQTIRGDIQGVRKVTIQSYKIITYNTV